MFAAEEDGVLVGGAAVPFEGEHVEDLYKDIHDVMVNRDVNEYFIGSIVGIKDQLTTFIYDGQQFKDFKFTTRFKIIGGTVEQMAGVVFRFQNESNFYVLRASALGKKFKR